MSNWAAGYSVGLEVRDSAVQVVLERFLDVLRSQNLHRYSGKLGFLGSFDAEILDLEVRDFQDPAPVGGGVRSDLEAEGAFRMNLFGFIPLDITILFQIDDVSFNLSQTAAGLPKGIVLSITPTLRVRIRFPSAPFLLGWLFNKIIGPLIAFGVWLAFRIIRRVEIPVWELVDVFSTLGLRFAKGSPLLTAQQVTGESSLQVASDFNLTNQQLGDPDQLGVFLPAKTNIGGVVHERVLTAAVQLAFLKGWVPSRFRVSSWKIYINIIRVRFEQERVVASGSLKARRGKCWCRVKVRIRFTAGVEPEVTDVNTSKPRVAFQYDASVNAHISTSGMLVVLGVIMFAPVFLALTLSLSHLVNTALQKFFPFNTTWNIAGVQLTVQAASIDFKGFVPFSMEFPLQLSGAGMYSLERFQQFQLPGGAQLNVGFTTETLTIQPEELRAAVQIH